MTPRPNPVAAALGADAPKRRAKERAPVAPALLDVQQAAELFGVGVRTVHKLRLDPEFPKPIALGPRATRWKVGELIAWLDAQPRRTDRPEPPELTAARAERRSAGGTAGGRGGGTLTPDRVKPRQTQRLTSGADFELANRPISDPWPTPK